VVFSAKNVSAASYGSIRGTFSVQPGFIKYKGFPAGNIPNTGYFCTGIRRGGFFYQKNIRG